MNPDNNIGILLTNIGSPDDPSPHAVKRYLAEFLTDPRVIKTPAWLWRPILHGFILRTRPYQSAKMYQKIWTDEGAPLVLHSKMQALILQKTLLQRVKSQKVFVALGMHYGQPSIKQALADLQNLRCNKILVFPLFPQYSSTTTASAFDKVNSILKSWDHIPELRFVNGYSDEACYIDVLTQSIKTYWETHGANDHVLFSFHGIPMSYVAGGDPYPFQCLQTAERLATSLGLSNKQWSLAYQSRLGPAPWLRPYCDASLRALPKQGVAKIDVVCPGFSADCLETLEEIAIQNKAIFMKAGGLRYRYIPALNADAKHIEALTTISLKHLCGWID